MEIQVGTHFFVSESSYTNLSYYEKQEKILQVKPRMLVSSVMRGIGPGILSSKCIFLNINPRK